MEIKNTVRLFDAGMMMARINISHGTIKQNCTLINKFKQAKRLRPHKTIGFMCEVRGREIRLTDINQKGGELLVQSSTNIILNCTNAPSFSNSETLYCNSDVIQRYLKPNDVVNIDDGRVVAIVKETKLDNIVLDVKIGGIIRSKSQVRFIGGQHVNLPLFAKNDLTDLQRISRLINIDYLVLPFASSGVDIKKAKEQLGDFGKDIKILAKIDTLNGIENYDDIITHCDGTIIQRNELAFELQSEKLMIAQKWAIQQCNKKAKLVMIQS